jgi:hypothetical protein
VLSFGPYPKVLIAKIKQKECPCMELERFDGARVYRCAAMDTLAEPGPKITTYETPSLQANTER